MMTLRQFSLKPESILSSTSWYLADLGEARGKQDLFTKQSPQKLKVLRENAMIESAVSSNRIEGVTVDQARIRTLVFGRPVLRDRDEEEVRGYRDALKLIHEQGKSLPVSEETILNFHRLCRGDIWDAGKYKERDGDIIERYANGRERIRFKPVEATKTPTFMHDLIEMWDHCIFERWVHPLIAMAAFNLDFLCIHPFRDGNGRVSRLLLLLQCYHLAYEVGRYISLERLIEQNKNRYYETLEQSSDRWHDGKHNPWPYINYVLYTLKTAYREFEERVGQITSPKGAKTELVLSVIRRHLSPFRISDIQKECPGVSLDLIRSVLKNLRSSGKVKCLGRGQSAEWEKTAKWK
ncbi:MAG: Fic family protein [Deltaproteobacteria bacterium CG_4_8_14_3_um_filter_45_9]|nr:MAG: Fic family protein [Deltaproteobacteria bacterium CG03_land_8_20_14_0_80_45_14]PIX26605.1 MAG: Fic family protein [Deltaproteobacteria bacterium CG_4_8_14_3_um_filter_45_9]